MTQIEFLFLGGSLAIDLVNTRRSRRVPGSWQLIQFDQLWDAAQVNAWWKAACRAHGIVGSATAWHEKDVNVLRELRAELRGLFESIIHGQARASDVPTLNRILAKGSFSVSMTASGPKSAYKRRDGVRDPLLAIAISARELLAERALSRLHSCHSDLCTSLFYDTTRSGTRAWCRPQCMNRARARANYWKAAGGKR